VFYKKKIGKSEINPNTSVRIGWKKETTVLERGRNRPLKD